MPEWCFTILAWLLFAAALGIGAWALIGDRPRGRRRCPRCWYDMSAVAGLQCPECGIVHPVEQSLHRRRRRWRLLPVAIILALASTAAFWGPAFHRRGVRSLPSTILVLLPFDPAVISGDAANPRGWEQAVWDELDYRCLEFELAGWHMRHLAARYSNRRDPGIRLVAYPIQDLAPVNYGKGRDVGCYWGWDGALSPRDDWSRELEYVVASLGWGWDESATLGVKGAQGYLFVRGSPRAHQKVAGLLEGLRTDGGNLDFTVYERTLERLRTTAVRMPGGPPTLRDLAREIERQTGVQVLLGEDLGRAGVLPESRVRVEAGSPSAAGVLEGISLDQDWPNGRIGWDITAAGVIITANERESAWLVVYPVGDLLTVVESEDLEETHAQVVGPIREEYEYPPTAEDLRDIISSMLDMDSWIDNGGDVGQIRSFRDHLLIETTTRRHCEIAEFLGRLRGVVGRQK